MLSADHFSRSRAAVLCFGAGGAGLAIVLHLLERADCPTRIIVTDPVGTRLDGVRGVHESWGNRGGRDVQLECVQDTRAADELLAGLPPESLVINATGMGKDRPGSPVSDQAAFPGQAVCWDLNYRGDLHFLQQAQRQADGARLRVEDGWVYFLHGWTEHMAQVFGLDLTPALFDRLRAIADRWSGGHPGSAGSPTPGPPTTGTK